MSLKIREFSATPEDIAAVVEIDNLCDPEHQYTAEQFRYDLENFDTKKYVLRYYLAEKDERVVGYACYHHMPHRFEPKRFWVWVGVHPAFQGQGIGSALYERILSDLRKLSARWLHTSARETWTKSREFLEKRGFQEVMRSWESWLDVRSFDFSRFQRYLEEAKAVGVTFATLAEESEKEAKWPEKIYDLHTAIMADVPSSSPYTPPPLDHFRRTLIENPDLLPDGFFIAKVGEEYVGESFVFRVPAEPGHLTQGLTGVRREHRGKGIAMALKLHVIRYAQEKGYTLIKTWNATNNIPMLAINEKLGFVRQPAWIEYQKTLG
ncbi:GNAT family N-acetyltransferase [Candidatus Bipolaricaulota bacterium]|nr:GNAT family N-acetyltransferase [Candidatus Bipolaricaulota bacterium]